MRSRERKYKLKDVIITMLSSVKGPMGEDSTELITDGSYTKNQWGCVFAYSESDATGYDGSETVVSVCPGERLELVRTGNASTELLIETDERNYCTYRTPFGEMTISTLAKRVEADLGEDWAEIAADYVLDINSVSAGEYSLKISIRPDNSEKSMSAEGCS